MLLERGLTDDLVVMVGKLMVDLKVVKLVGEMDLLLVVKSARK